MFGIVVWAVATGQLAWNYLLIVGLEPLGAIWTAAALGRPVRDGVTRFRAHQLPAHAALLQPA